MREQLLGIAEVAQRLGISRRQVYRLLPRLRATGLQQVLVGRQKRYRAASLDRLIRAAAERERPLVDAGARAMMSPPSERAGPEPGALGVTE